METTMNETDRRDNMTIAIACRDEILDLAAEAARGELSLEQTVTLHGDIISFLDGVHCRRFPGVAARLRTGLADLGWSFAKGEAARAELNAQVRAKTAPGSTCHKCNGTKILRAFMHIDNGRCFQCGGSGRL